MTEHTAEKDARLWALADRWDEGEDVGVSHVIACQDSACKTCVVIACASDLRAELRAIPPAETEEAPQ